MNTKTYTTDLYEGESFSLMELENRITCDLDAGVIDVGDINISEFYIIERVDLNFEIGHSVIVTELSK